MNVSRAGAAV